MPEFKERMLRWMDAKKRECKLKQSDEFDSTYLDCGLCKASVESVRIFLRMHMDSTVISLIRNFCTILHIETASVCKGIVEAFRVSKFTVDFNGTGPANSPQNEFAGRKYGALQKWLLV